MGRPTPFEQACVPRGDGYKHLTCSGQWMAIHNIDRILIDRRFSIMMHVQKIVLVK